MKKCKVCKVKFEPTYNSMQKVCGPKCALELVNSNKKKEKAKSVKRARSDLRELNRNSSSWQHKQTQKAFNKMRVLQELLWFKSKSKEPECISCGKTSMDWCCGHFKTVGAHGELRYDTANTYLQCNRYCNLGLSGNINGNKTTRGYLQGLVDRFGESRAKQIIEYCESQPDKKWQCDELEEMRKGFNAEIRRLEALLNG